MSSEIELIRNTFGETGFTSPEIAARALEELETKKLHEFALQQRKERIGNLAREIMQTGDWTGTGFGCRTLKGTEFLRVDDTSEVAIRDDSIEKLDEHGFGTNNSVYKVELLLRKNEQVSVVAGFFPSLELTGIENPDLKDLDSLEHILIWMVQASTHDS